MSQAPSPENRAPEGYQWTTRAPVAPFYAAGCGFALYALLGPLYAWWHLLLAALTGGACFFVAKLLFRPKRVLAPIETPKPQPPAQPSLQGLPREAQQYLKAMRQADVAIEDESVSQKIRMLEDRTRKIFEVVSEQPGKEGDIRRLVTYYLPMLLKLLHSYDRLEERGIRSGNIGRSMQQIEQVLDTAILAFDHQLDNLFQHEAMDISSDITVLENLMEQEGLTQEGPLDPPATKSL